MDVPRTRLRSARCATGDGQDGLVGYVAVTDSCGEMYVERHEDVNRALH